MGIFSGANEAALLNKRPPRLSDYLGTHLVKVTSLKTGMGQGKSRAPYFAAELEIVKSENPSAKGKVSLAFVKNAAWPEYFFSDIKRLIGAIANKDPSAIGEKHMDAAVSDAQPAAGKLLGVRVTTRTKDGKTYPDFEFFAADLSLALESNPALAPSPSASAPTKAAPANDDTDDPVFG